MSTKTILVSVLIGIVVIGSGYFFLRIFSNNNAPVITNVSSSKLISQSDWKTYENTAFKYRVQYQSNISVEPLDRYDYTTPITEKSPISIGAVDVMAWEGVGTGENGFSVKETQRLASLDLKSFAEAIRIYQANNQNPNVRNEHVGYLQAMTLASSTAYYFVLSGAYVNSEGGYLIPSNATNRYIFVESPNKTKFIIWYPENDFTSQQIVDSFRFTD